MQPLANDENTLRIYFQNINGLETNTNLGDWASLCEALHPFQIGILGLVETNIAWNPSIIHEYKRTAGDFLLSPVIRTS